MCTLVTSGQVASNTNTFLASASFLTCCDTPWALKITVAPSGTSAISSTKIAPLLISSSTTVRLCTTSCRTYIGAPKRSMARLTISMALSTPAQNPLGCASLTLTTINFSLEESRSTPALLKLFQHQKQYRFRQVDD